MYKITISDIQSDQNYPDWARTVLVMDNADIYVAGVLSGSTEKAFWVMSRNGESRIVNDQGHAYVEIDFLRQTFPRVRQQMDHIEQVIHYVLQQIAQENMGQQQGEMVDAPGEAPLIMLANAWARHYEAHIESQGAPDWQIKRRNEDFYRGAEAALTCIANKRDMDTPLDACLDELYSEIDDVLSGCFLRDMEVEGNA